MCEYMTCMNVPSHIHIYSQWFYQENEKFVFNYKWYFLGPKNLIAIFTLYFQNCKHIGDK